MTNEIRDTQHDTPDFENILKERFKSADKPNDDMKVITVMTRKGGAGKTTLLQALVSAALSEGKQVLCLDADPQQGLHRWLKPLSENEERIMSRQLIFANHLEGWTEAAYEVGTIDLVFVDTQGAAGEWIDELAEHSDFLVVPMKMADKDLSITVDTFNWYVGLRERTEEPELLPVFRIIFSDVPPKPTATQREIEARALATFPIMDNYFMHRNQHLEADAEGFLHTRAEEKRTSGFGLARTHAKHFDEALAEASDILKEIVGED